MRAYSRAEQAADETIHVIGVLAALLAVPVMVTLAAVWRDDGAMIAAVAIYGVTMVAMLGFSADTIWPTCGRGVQNFLIETLRRLDHAAIYVKIAGTYTPYAVIAGGPVGRWMLIGVWSGAVLGLLGKLIAPEPVGTRIRRSLSRTRMGIRLRGGPSQRRHRDAGHADPDHRRRLPLHDWRDLPHLDAAALPERDLALFRPGRDVRLLLGHDG